MNSKTFLFPFFVLAILLVFSQEIQAGGIFLRNPTINGFQGNGDVEVAQNSTVSLCYNITDYFFSGHGTSYSYLPFMILHPVKLEGSVGRGGKNFPGDVIRIKSSLKRINMYGGAIDATVDERLYNAIEQFQQNFSGQNPDGRIDVSGKTLRTLNIELADLFVVKLNQARVNAGPPTGHYSIQDCVNFKVPGKVDRYEIYYSNAPLIVDYKIGMEMVIEGKTFTVLSINEQRMVKRLFRDYHPTLLASFRVVPSGSQYAPPIATYLRLNGGIPNIETRIKPGESEKPVTFSWFVRPGTYEVEYRYRLYPDQSEWSPWTRRTSVDYFFIGIGAHTFTVDTRYRAPDGSWQSVPRCSHRFYLDHAFISRPAIYKASGGSIHPGESQPVPDFKNLYAKSKALLIGVSDFADPAFSPLPFVKNDIARMKDVLTKEGFEVTALVGSKTRVDIIAALEDFLANLEPNDRVLVYFSTHGFQDRVVKSRAYLAAADCDTNRPGVNCISLEGLENILKRAIRLPVRHLLIVLDACSSGLGVITKSPEYKELNVAVEPGAHMITAGLADQEAVVDRDHNMSLFTWYLTQGLEGKADYTEDKIVTLTELLLYTRYNVAKETNGAQTPMIGRLKGPGEMVFISNPQ